MATPGPNHYMREYTNAQLRAMIDDPIVFSVPERLDAGAILRERQTATLREYPGDRAIRLADALDACAGSTGEDYAEASYLRMSFRRDCRPGGPIGCHIGDFGPASRYLDCVQVRLDRARERTN